MTCNDGWEFTRSKGFYTHKNLLQEEMKNVQFDILINSDISFLYSVPISIYALKTNTT